MSKETDLKELSVGALKRVAEWLQFQGRAVDDFSGWRKDQYVEWLAAKLSREQVDGLLSAYDPVDPYYDDRQLAKLLGLPQKEQILARSSKETLREAMERLERRGQVQIFWKSLSADDLRDYLRGKLSKEEAADLLWGLRQRQPRASRASESPEREPERQTRFDAVSVPNRAHLRCLVISPGDVEEEREAVARAIADFNARLGPRFGAFVEAVRWETHATPIMGDEPQAIINRQIVDDCHMAIAIFWTRLGTPTLQHPSGSAEEIERLLARGSPVSVYFSQRPVDPTRIDVQQYARLLEAKATWEKRRGLLGKFDSAESLQRLVALHMASHVESLLTARGNAPASSVSESNGRVTTATVTDVRVTVGAVDAVDPRRPGSAVSYVRIRVENHSDHPVFLTGVSLALPGDDRWVISERDATGALVAVKRELRPHDSTDYLYAPDHIYAMLDGAPPADLVVHDAIQRRFRAPAGALALALGAARAKPSVRPATFKERVDQALEDARAAVAACQRIDNPRQIERVASSAFDRLQAFTNGARLEVLVSGERDFELAGLYEDEGQRLQDALLSLIREARAR